MIKNIEFVCVADTGEINESGEHMYDILLKTVSKDDLSVLADMIDQRSSISGITVYEYSRVPACFPDGKNSQTVTMLNTIHVSYEDVDNVTAMDNIAYEVKCLIS